MLESLVVSRVCFFVCVFVFVCVCMYSTKPLVCGR